MGNQQRTVVLYGQSLVMGGLAASLAKQPALALHTVSDPAPDLVTQLTRLHPDVVIFDLATSRPDDLWGWLLTQPRCLLLGIDLDQHAVHQWLGQHTRALTIPDLVQAIEQEPS